MRVPGIEPESRPWQGRVLPLNHTRNNKHTTLYLKKHKIVLRRSIECREKVSMNEKQLWEICEIPTAIEILSGGNCNHYTYDYSFSVSNCSFAQI